MKRSREEEELFSWLLTLAVLALMVATYIALLKP